MKRPTQVDVARLAGVSRATVSYVINGQTDGRVPISEDTRQRVLEAVEQLGYVPDARAQSLRSGDTNTIGLIIPDIRNPHFWEHAEGVEQEARASGYHMLLSDIALNSEYAEEIFKGLSRRRIDGLIFMGSFIDQSEEAKKILTILSKRGLPLVEISDHNIDYEVDFVISDYRAATNEVMAYLLALQHRRIGLIYGVATPVLAEDRLHPYQEGLLAAGLPVEQELIARCGPTIEDGYQAALQLLKLPNRPTAIISINDLLAIGALRAAQDLGLDVPADLSLVGYDDIQMAKYLVPRLTTVAKDSIRVGQEAVKQLLARVNNPDLPRQKINVPPQLIKRESTGPAPTL
ncbi:MAG: LacI family DNA-binding transcriptional regulator [Anaerolineae bacterium]|nr:LacI family DNA-binding transcriptional regulator [Anaerolineae bacterium]